MSRNIYGNIFFVFQRMWLQYTDTTKCKLQSFFLLFRLVFLLDLWRGTSACWNIQFWMGWISASADGSAWVVHGDCTKIRVGCPNIFVYHCRLNDWTCFCHPLWRKQCFGPLWMKNTQNKTIVWFKIQTNLHDTWCWHMMWTSSNSSESFR